MGRAGRSWACSALSVACFGQVLERLPWPANYLLMFTVSFVVGMLSTWSYAQIDIPVREPAPVVRTHLPLRARLAELVQPFRNGSGFLTFSLITLAMRLGIWLPSGVFSIFLVRNLQASDAWIGGRTTLENSALTLGYYFWGRMAGRLTPGRMLALATAAMGSAYALGSTATPGTRWLLLCTALLWGFFISAVDVSLFEWLLAVMPPAERPRYVALNTLLLNLVMFLAPMLGAAIAGQAGIPTVLRSAAGCLFVCAVITLLLTRAVSTTGATEKLGRGN